MTITPPSGPEGLQEDLSKPERLKDLWENPEALKAYMQGYAENFAKADRGEVKDQIRDEVNAQVDEKVQAKIAEYLRDHPADTAADAIKASYRGTGSAMYNPDALGARLDGTFDSIGEHALAFIGSQRLRNKLAPKASKYTQILNSFGSEVPDAGGFLIPEVLRSQLLAIALETAVVRPRATVIPMDSLRVPIPMIDDTSHVTNVFGGIQWYWTEEAASITESQASFGRVVLDAKKLAAYAAVPNELMDDAPAFSGFLEARFPQALAFGEDVGFFTGTGAGEPQGFINCQASINVAKQAGQATGTILWENIVNMYPRMLPTSIGKAVWICSHDTFPELATMALAVGTGGGPVWIGNYGGGQGGMDLPPATILGRPVIFTEKASTLSTAGDINFVDLSYYLVGDRMAMSSMLSEHFLFQNDKTAFRIIERVDGRPWLQSAITPHNNSSSTLTPFVQLASR